MSHHALSSELFEPGRNCWRVECAERAAFLVDADAYFKAFVAAARRAQRSILIAGWDFHSRTRLLCEDEKGRELELGAFLNDLVRRKRGLHVHILVWDYPMIFGLDREWSPSYGFGWKPKRRVHFKYDNTHSIGASHHQKVVVIDDAVAFCGGIDLTCKRWDTCEHAPDNARRVVQGAPYPPFHDLAMAVDGDAARALGDLFRERWRRATGKTLAPAYVRGSDPWPQTLAPSVSENLRIAISRTEPPDEEGRGVREVEAMYLDMIARARRSIYIENQYFTADTIGAALARRLAEPDGPEIIVVLRQLSHGWLEEVTMQTLRARLIETLRAADQYGRFRVYYPYVAGLQDGTCIDVHAKMMIVDDEFVRIGSANLANRSMGLDTECDLSLAAAGRADIAAAISRLRSALLAEHLGCEPEQVDRAVREGGSLRAAIDALQRPERKLEPLTDLPQVSEAVLDVVAVADPEKPVELSDLAALFSNDSTPQRNRPQWSKLVVLAGVIAALTALWKLTPLAELLEPERVVGWARQFGAKWWAPLVTILAYTPAAAVMFPRPLITLFAVVAFGPWLGFLYAMLGIELAAWLTFAAGKRLDRAAVRRVAGAKLNEIIQVMRRRGLPAITALRLVPLAPFAVEGVVAGAIRVKPWHFLLGTALGMLPGTLTSTVFGDQLQAALEDPSKVNYWLIGAVIVLLGVATWWVRRWLVRSAADVAHVDEVRRVRTA
jgi:Phosphatidylserine/phosphatidylglycerophosphate/cardiolipin synthases and related enzymes